MEKINQNFQRQAGRQREGRTATGEGPEAPEWTKMVDRVRLNSVRLWL